MDFLSMDKNKWKEIHYGQFHMYKFLYANNKILMQKIKARVIIYMQI